MESEKNKRISFLDVLVERRGDSIRTSVYRKSTHTGRYLDYWSHHHPKTKTGVISCFKKRAECICLEEDSKKTEINRLKEVFIANGFPQNTVKAVMRKKTKTCNRLRR